VWITYLYCSPLAARLMVADQYPFFSLIKGSRSIDQPLNSPLTVTRLAFGAQTRNVVPVECGKAPIPGCPAGFANPMLRQVADQAR
jgi:hypothetical protein